MQGHKEPSFFFTKNYPAPAGEVEGHNSRGGKRVGQVFLVHLTFRSRQGIKSTTRRHATHDKVNAAVIRQWGGRDAASE